MDKIPVDTGKMNFRDLIQLLKFVSDKAARLNLFSMLLSLIGSGEDKDYAEMDELTKKQYKAYVDFNNVMK